MSNNYSQYSINELLLVGYPLQEIGINNWGLDKEQALTILKILNDNNVAVLGGDVYEVSDSKIISTSDSWGTDKGPGENNIQYINRSIQYSIDYILNYPNKKVLFALVLDIESD